MKFRCERDVLIDALTTVGRAVSARGAPSGHQPGVLIEAQGSGVHLVGHDFGLDLIIEKDIGVAGLSDGSCVLPTPLVADIVRAFDPGAVAIDADDEEARITSGKSEFAVRTYPVIDFPKPPAPDGEGVALDAARLSESIRQVVRAAAAEDKEKKIAAQFTGVLLADEGDALRLVATDGYRLAFRDIEEAAGLGEGKRLLVPARALRELQRLVAGGEDERVVLHSSEAHAFFDVGPVRMTTRMINADFPEYRQLIQPNYPNSLVLDKGLLLDALRRMRLLASAEKAAFSVRLDMSGSTLQLSATSAEYGHAQEEVDVKFQGTELSVAFNPSFLIDGIEGVADGEVLVKTVDESKPAMVRGVESGDYHYLVMPVHAR